MRVLVTGHRGYIGVGMMPALRAAGHEAIGLDIGLYDGCDFGNPPQETPAIAVDIRDVTPAHLEGFDGVVHLAALSNDPLGDLSRELTYEINLHASVRLARAAKAAGVARYLFASSCSLYGASGSEAPLDEGARFNPVTAYGESKIRVEQEVGALADATFSPVFLRNATAYGVSPRLRADIVVNNLVGYAFTTGEVLLQSDGTPWRPLVHVGDIHSAFVAALSAPREAVHNEAFNVGRTSENFQIRQVAEMVAEIVPGSRVAFAAGASADIRNYRVSFVKAETRLPGFAPCWTLREGIRELYEAYRANGLTREEFLGPRYFRLKTVRERLAGGLLDRDLRPVGGATLSPAP
jgi:nucleoside-diphosphate-sugar epimerase